MTDGLIAGRFHLRSLLGSGGTASVFAAFDERTGREIALKLLHPHLAVERSVWDAFFEEVRAAQSIDHPGLAEIFDAGSADSDPPVVWIAMERVRGVSLADHVREHGPLEVVEAVALASAVLDALAAAHAGGVVHRDVTPANVMLDPELLGAPFDRAAFESSIRLLDFGLADIPGRSTVGADALLSAVGAAPAGVVASVPYASPEQLSAGAVSEASDLYQMGATLHFALTGRAPFVGDTPAVVRAHLSAPPPVPSAIRRGLPRELDRVVTTAMLKRPADRYADAAAMRLALGSAVAPFTGRPFVGAPDAATDVVGAPGGAAAATGVTRMYRTSVPVAQQAPPPATPAHRPDESRPGGWRTAGTVVAILAVLSAIVGLSAMAASTSSPAPTVSAPPSPSLTPSPTAEPRPVESPPPSLPRAPIPELTGLSLADARAALERAGLVLGEVSREMSASAADTVLGSTPAGGEDATVGAAVALRVASGENVVPSVIGLPPTEAVGILTAAGFSSEITEVADGTPGLVAGSSPGAGEVSRVGGAVILAVPRARTPTPTPTPTPVPTTTPTGVPTPLPTTSQTPRT